MGLVQKAFSDIITFSRSSNATRVGPTGVLEYAPHNLLTYSEQFDNAAWTQYQASVTANSVAAPNGTVTADTLIENTANDAHALTRSISLGVGTFTVSLYIKAASGVRNIGVVPANNGSMGCNGVVSFNGSGEFVSTSGTGIVSYNSTSVGNGWYRLSVVFSITTAGTASPVFRLENGGSVTYTGDGTSGIYLWGAQLAVGPYALDYTPTTSAAVYGPRFDYDPVTLAARGLLVEEQRQNLLPASNDFSNVTYWVGGGYVTANATTSPDGTVNAAIGASIYPASGVGDATVAISGSIFAKANPSGASSLVLRINRFGSATDYLEVTFNLSTGVAGAVTNSGTASGGSASMIAFGNGWYRCVLSGTVSTTAGTLSFNPQSTCFIYGAQLEAGSFATSYIPTLASTVTRSADVASVNTLSPWYNSSESTLFAEFDFIGATLGGGGIAQLTNNISNNGLLLYQNAASLNVSAYVDASSVLIGSNSVNVPAKVALAYNGSSNGAVRNGGAVSSVGTTVSAAATQFSLGSFYGGVYQFNGHLRRVASYPRRLTNAELQALTA